MPVLKCSPDNIHDDSKLSFEINLLNKDSEWQDYELVLNIGAEARSFRSIDREELTQTGVMGRVGKFAFSLQPKNELKTLVKLIKNFLDDEKQKVLKFEPADPSFELNLEKGHAGEYKVYIWVDAGNTKHLEYTWDAQGLRFYTTKENILSFIDGL